MTFIAGKDENMKSDAQQKVVFQLSNNDTFVHKSLIRQLNNVLKAFHNIHIEVVTHGYGVDLLLTNGAFQASIRELHEQGVAFMVCKNTLEQEDLCATRLLDFTEVVPSGIAHVIVRQSEGWSYIKASF